MLPAPDCCNERVAKLPYYIHERCPFRTSLARCAPPRDDMLKMAVGRGWPRTPLPVRPGWDEHHKCLVVLLKSSCSAVRLNLFDCSWTWSLAIRLNFLRLLHYKISLHEFCMNLRILLCKLDHVMDMHREPARVVRMVQCVEPAAEFIA